MTNNEKTHSNNSPIDREVEQDSRFWAIVDLFQSDLQNNNPVTIEDYIRRHPDFESAIKIYFPTIVALEEAAHGQNVEATHANSKDGSTQGFGPEFDSSWTTIGPYVIDQPVGRGGMGVVYRAMQPGINRIVALKILPVEKALNPDMVERFKREAQALGRTSHPSIVPVFEVGEGTGQTKSGRSVQLHYYAMQFVDGLSLDKIIRINQADRTQLASTRQDKKINFREVHGIEDTSRKDLLSGTDTHTTASLPAKRDRGRFGKTEEQSVSKGPAGKNQDLIDLARKSKKRWNNIAKLGIQAAEAIDHAHQREILHRDIKPSNLLIDHDEHVWVADFGLAKLADTEQTSTDGVVGTLRYMSPERFKGWSDPRSDIYGLGMTLFEVATLEPAFSEDDRAILIEKIIRGEYKSPRQIDSSIPIDLETIILKAIELDPSHRYQTALELKNDLVRFLEQKPILARRPSLLSVVSQWSYRNPITARLGFALIAVVFIALIGTTLFSQILWQQNNQLSDNKKTLEANALKLLNNQDQLKSQRDDIALLLEKSLSNELLANLQSAALLSHSGEIGQKSNAIKVLRRTLDLIRNQLANRDNEQSINKIRTAMAHAICQYDAEIKCEIEVGDGNACIVSRQFNRIIRQEMDGDQSIFECFADLSFEKPEQKLGEIHPQWSTPLKGEFDLGLFSPSGNYFIVTERNTEPVNHKNSKVIDSETGAVIGDIPSAKFCCLSDESLIAYVQRGPDGAKQIRFFDVNKRMSTPENLDSNATVDGLFGSQDGKQIFLWGYSNHLETIEIETGKTQKTWIGDPIEVADSFPENSLHALGSTSGEVYLFDSKKNNLTHRLSGHRTKIISLSFSKDGDVLAAASENTIRFWETSSGRLLLEVPARVHDIQFHCDKDFLIVNYGNNFNIYNMLPNSCYRVAGISNQFPTDIRTSPDGHLIAIGHAEFIELYDSFNLRRLVSVSRDRNAQFEFDPKTGDLLTVLDRQFTRWPIRFADDGKLLVGPNKMLVHNVSSNFGVSMDGKRIALRMGSDVNLFDEEFEQLTRIPYNEHVGGMAFSPDNSLVAILSQQLAVFEIESGKRVFEQRLEGMKSNPVISFPSPQKLVITWPGHRQTIFDCKSWQIESETELSGDQVLRRTEEFFVKASGHNIKIFKKSDPGWPILKLEFPEPRELFGFAFRPEFGRVYATTDNFELHAWDLSGLSNRLAGEGLGLNSLDGEFDIPQSGPLSVELKTDGKLRMGIHVIGETIKPPVSKSLPRKDEASKIPLFFRPLKKE